MSRSFFLIESGRCCGPSQRSSHFAPAASLSQGPKKKTNNHLHCLKNEMVEIMKVSRGKVCRECNSGTLLTEAETLSFPKINFVVHLYIYFKCTQQQVQKKLAAGSEAPKTRKSAFGWKAIFAASNSRSCELIMQDLITAS